HGALVGVARYREWSVESLGTRSRSPAAPPAAAAVLCAVSLAVCASVTGWSIGLLFGAAVTLALTVPAVTSLPSNGRALAAVTCAVLVAAAGWVVAARIGTASQAAAVAVLLAAFAMALAGITATLARTRMAPPLAAAVVTTLALAWLSWPVWLSADAATVDRLVAVHPLLAMNGAMESSEPWTQWPVMYRLTSLGQDVPYALPRTAWPAVVAHAIVSAVTWAVTTVPVWRRAGE
ncbi:MAG TPA: hypothetical protein VK324_04285, partial [Tepidisphaeraceae bacterium]|nr:hypothetical protein [Tepidisphaeraceae bacterium]